jgi:hypothetical protein
MVPMFLRNIPFPVPGNVSEGRTSFPSDIFLADSTISTRNTQWRHFYKYLCSCSRCSSRLTIPDVAEYAEAHVQSLAGLKDYFSTILD